MEESKLEIVVDQLIKELAVLKTHKVDDKCFCDLSDIGNTIGIVIGENLNKEETGYEKSDFELGLRHGFSLVDGTHG